ncbi:RNA-binding protein 6 isoform X2 [Rhinoderma darwinii]|uniref:RNA-binding protein 6 isoform X2 n=1 Tax=Rhinoderma darwinii TaxID=43563 RepID=UPI003F669F13
MWGAPRQPAAGFRDRSGESFPQRMPQGSHPRMRGRLPFPFQGGSSVPNANFGGPGGVPFMRRNMAMDGCWEEGRMQPEDQMPLSRRGRLPMNYRAAAFREAEVTDTQYREMGAHELDFRSRLAPDMDYRGREASNFDQRGMPDVDYRHEEGPAIAYRERLPPPPIFRERESLEYRRRMLAEIELREREALEQRRQRMAAVPDYAEREVAELEYKRRLDALFREREEMSLRERESSELLRRDRGALHRERSAVDYEERGSPAHFREPADLDLRFRKPDLDVNFMDKERGPDYRERMVIDYLHNEKPASGAEYMEVDYSSKKLQTDMTLDEQAGLARRVLESLGAAYREGQTPNATYKKRKIEIPGLNSDADYREKDSADSDYREKETSDSDYRDRDNTDSDYRDIEVGDSDYRDKESADSDYRGTESADADYRKSADNGVKKSAKTGDDGSKPETKQKALKSLMTAPDLAPKSLSNSDQRIPFLSYDKPQTSPLPKMSNDAPHPEGPQSAAKGDGNSKSNKCNYPGKLDVDFRDRPKPEDLHQEAKKVAHKVPRFSAEGSKPLCPTDQDLRGKGHAGKAPAEGGGDQDFRTDKYMQKKDEDLRTGKGPASSNVLGHSLLYDFIKLAAKELRQQREKVGETEGPTAINPPEKPPMARMSQPAASTMKSAAGHSPVAEFLGRQDTDYRNMDYKDVDLRVGYSPDKKSHEALQPGSKDKDYRRTTVPDGATRIIWMDGLPTGASREDILSALASAHPQPEHGVNLIGYVPGYSFGSVCVEFSLVEEAVGCMEANKGTLHFKGKKINLKYIPNSDRWNCQQCKVVNVLSKERCWQCSALRAGSDHLPLRDALKDPKMPPVLSSRRANKRKAMQSPTTRSPDSRKKRIPPRERSLQFKTKGGKPAKSESATVIIKGIGVNTTPENVVKALQPYVELSVRNVRIMKNHRKDRWGFGFVDLKNHKEAIRLTVLVRELKPPLTVNGRPITVDLAVGERKNEPGKFQKGNKTSSGKNRNRRAQRRALTYPGFKATVDDGPSYVFDPKTGNYVDPLTNACYNEAKTQRKKDDSHQAPGSEKKEPSSQQRRGFTEDDKVKDSEEEAFKRPLPPPGTKKEEPPPEPKHNPLIKLIGEYGDDSEEDEEEEELKLLPPIKKKTAAPPPPPPAPKPAPKPALPTSRAAGSLEEKLTDWKKMVCLLCRRQFPGKDSLLRHQKFSDLHKQNLNIQEKIRKSQKELVYLQQKEQEGREVLDSDVRGPGKKKSKGSETGSDLKVKSASGPRPAGETYRENMKRLILERYKELE